MMWFLVPSGKLTVWPWNWPIYSGFTSLSTPTTGRVYVNWLEGTLKKYFSLTHYVYYMCI